MERPANLADQEFLTDEEAANLDQEAFERIQALADRPARRTEVDPSGNVDRGIDGAPGSYNDFWFDRGTSVIPTKRTSLVVDPPDGRIPELTPEAEREREAAEVLEPEDFMSDAEADADALASAGWGTDEDYGYYG